MIEKIKKLREKTGAGVMDARRALEEANGNMVKAEEIIRLSGLERVEKKISREVKSGRVEVYSHQTGKLVGVVELACETDFVAGNDEFVKLAREIAMQVASMSPVDVDELLGQDYIRDGSKKISDLVSELIAKTGENIKIVRFVRMELGEE